MKSSVLNKIIGLVIGMFVLEGIIFLGSFNFEEHNIIKLVNTQTASNIRANKLSGLKNLVDVAYSVVNTYYEKSKDINSLKKIKANELKTILEGVAHQIKTILKNEKDKPKSVVENEIKQLVASYRYHGKNYIWINDMHPRMIMHPIKPQLDGKDLSNFKDIKGNYLFDDMVKVCKEKGQGMVSYYWPKPGEKVAKLKVSYVILIPELNWIIGTGEWVEDITHEMQQQALKQISSMRLANGNYFWINDLKGYMLAHPNEKLIGKYVGDLKDKRGKELIKDMIEICKQKGDGFIDYYWSKKGEPGDVLKTSYVKLFKPWGWVIGMGVYMDDIQKITHSQTRKIDSIMKKMTFTASVVGTIFIILAIIALVFLFRNLLKRPVLSLVEFAENISMGNLDFKLQDKFKGEFLTLQQSLEIMVENLKNKIQETEDGKQQAEQATKEARDALEAAEQAKKQAENAQKQGMLQAAQVMEGIVEHITTASEELSAQVQEVTQNMQEQKQRITEAATAMEQMNATVLEVAKNASQASENSDGTRQKAEEGFEVVKESIEEIKKVQDISLELNKNMEELLNQAQAIGRIINVINDIADQTNLLALNAAIEAARAGDAGRGFAVVADEVRKLAENTMAATKEVEENINHIRISTEKSNQKFQEALEAVKMATEKVDESGKVLTEIVELAKNSADQVRNIATAAEEQSSASEEITKNIEVISSLAESTAEGMEQSALAINEMAEQSNELQQLIAKLKSEDE